MVAAAPARVRFQGAFRRRNGPREGAVALVPYVDVEDALASMEKKPF